MANLDDVLSGTVDEAKERIEELEDPDYAEILEAEESGKNRKTLKTWLESRMEDAESETQEMDEKEEETVEEIEEETRGGMESSFSASQMAAGSILVGLIVGVVVGLGISGNTGSVGPSADPADIRNDVTSLVEQGQVENAQVSEVTKRAGMFFVNVTGDVQGENGTQTINRAFYVSPDGELLFPQVNSPFFRSPINIAESLSARQNRTGTGQ